MAHDAGKFGFSLGQKPKIVTEDGLKILVYEGQGQALP